MFQMFPAEVGLAGGIQVLEASNEHLVTEAQRGISKGLAGAPQEI